MPTATPYPRRRFLKLAVLLGAAGALLDCEPGLAQALPMVDEKDPTAVNLGYKADATKVDKAKFPKYTAGQSCANCQLYQGKPGAASGPCPIFSGKAVSAKGWCSAHVHKA